MGIQYYFPSLGRTLRINKTHIAVVSSSAQAPAAAATLGPCRKGGLMGVLVLKASEVK